MGENKFKEETIYSCGIDDGNIAHKVGSFIEDVSEELRTYIGVPKSMILQIILPIMSIVIGCRSIQHLV